MLKATALLTLSFGLTITGFAYGADKDLKAISNEDWAKSVKCEDYLSGTSDLKALKSLIVQYRATLISQIVAENRNASIRVSEHPLCDSICGRVAKNLKVFLTSRGYNVTQVIAEKLGSYSGEYISRDHTFLVVQLGERKIIVDGAYLSFLGQIGTDFKIDVARVIFGDILVLPYDQLDAWANELGQLRQRFYAFREARRPGALKERKDGLWDASLVYGITDEEFVKYVKRIWDFKDPVYQVK